MRMLNFVLIKKFKITLPRALKELEKEKKIKLYSIEQAEKYLKEKKIDFQGIITVGGDGTLLKAIPFAYKYDLPIIAVAKGNFGFLTEINTNQIVEIINLIQEKKFYVKKKYPILVEHKNQKIPALNEVAILKGPAGKIIHLEVKINNEHLTTVYGDGLIIATPTGSTAYNLSAGGPVLHEETQALVCTPICSFKINIKPFVFPDNFKIKVQLTNPKDSAHLLIDGQINIPFKTNDTLIASKAPKPVSFISPCLGNYLEKLRKKFKW